MGGNKLSEDYEVADGGHNWWTGRNIRGEERGGRRVGNKIMVGDEATTSFAKVRHFIC